MDLVALCILFFLKDNGNPNLIVNFHVLPLHVWIDAYILIAIARPVRDLLPQTEQLKELLSCNQAKDPLDLSLLVKILYVLLLQGLERCVSCRP